MFDIAFFGLAAALGFKHAFDADHVLAVSNFLSSAKNLRETAEIAVSWAAGHMLTAGIITFVLFSFKDVFLSPLLDNFETIVGIMLVVLGVLSLRNVMHFHSHRHGHGNREHEHPHAHFGISPPEKFHLHRKMLGVGIIHGLASNDELLLLFTVSLGVTGFAGLLLGIGFFSIGVVAGMLAFSIVLSIPILKAKGEFSRQAINALAGSASLVYGAMLLLKIA